MKFWRCLAALKERPGRTTLRFIAIRAIQMSAVLLVCLSGLGGATTARAQDGVTVRPDHLSLEVDAGSTAVVDILVENVTNLYGVQFQITFDPTILEVVDANPGKPGVQIQPGDFLSPDWLLDNTVDNENGSIAYALCQMSPSEPVSGDGVLATITWRGKAGGTSPIALTHMQLGAPRGLPIPANTEDGQIVVAPAGAPPADTPTPTIAPTETSTPLPPTSTPTFTPAPPTSTPPATSVPEATEPPVATPTLTPPSTAATTDVFSTQVATAPEKTETSPPVTTVVQPTSTAVPTARALPVPTEGQTLPTTPSPTPASSSGSSSMFSNSLTYIAVACLLVAAVGASVLWRRKH